MASRTGYGQHCQFYGIFGPFLTNQGKSVITAQLLYTCTLKTIEVVYEVKKSDFNGNMLNSHTVWHQYSVILSTKWKCRDGSHTCIQLDFQKQTGGSWVHRGWVRQRSPADCGTRSQSPPGWRSPSTTWSTRYRSLRTAPPTVARWASASVGDVPSWTASCAEGIKAAMIAHTWHPFF